MLGMNIELYKENPMNLKDGINNMLPNEQSDYELFNSIFYTPSKYGRTNYVEGEEKEMWNKLKENFELPDYDPYKYSFGVNDKDKIVELYQNGVADSRGFGGWIVKPKKLGKLRRIMK